MNLFVPEHDPYRLKELILLFSPYHGYSFVAFFLPVLTGAQLAFQIVVGHGVTQPEAESLALGQTLKNAPLHVDFIVHYTPER